MTCVTCRVLAGDGAWPAAPEYCARHRPPTAAESVTLLERAAAQLSVDARRLDLSAEGRTERSAQEHRDAALRCRDDAAQLRRLARALTIAPSTAAFLQERG